ncbi:MULTISPECIES: hypothetical protein [unclassified Rhizobium]|uniref:hypothetical protein n=1 Tax=unclassified Rhizobium TaxID=2613769 RepID=UPI0016125B32|nr:MULTISPECIES: hypothetical protein [unclassified Rhizobium]MBB3386171.1 hypothetical protein [Rhizobium sp. BK098]MBB3571146.1 hypothetical protein [Rhizobium sp. BK491]MBB3617875.1 hypothetical protein [Rhizobium sp. BK609]MBB3683672.1 hypothetical protein [Rhizobium sp. BK612]
MKKSSAADMRAGQQALETTAKHLWTIASSLGWFGSKERVRMIALANNSKITVFAAAIIIRKAKRL